MHGHFDESAGSIPPATAHVTSAEPAAMQQPEASDVADHPTPRPGAVPTSHARAFSHQDMLEYQEWAASGEFG